MRHQPCYGYGYAMNGVLDDSYLRRRSADKNLTTKLPDNLETLVGRFSVDQQDNRGLLIAHWPII